MSVNNMSKTPTHENLTNACNSHLFLLAWETILCIHVQRTHNILLPRILLYICTTLPLSHSSVFLSTYFTLTHTHTFILLAPLLSTTFSHVVCLALCSTSATQSDTIPYDCWWCESNWIHWMIVVLCCCYYYFKTSTLCSLSHSKRVQNSVRRQQCHTYTTPSSSKFNFNQIKW